MERIASREIIRQQQSIREQQRQGRPQQDVVQYMRRVFGFFQVEPDPGISDQDDAEEKHQRQPEPGPTDQEADAEQKDHILQ